MIRVGQLTCRRIPCRVNRDNASSNTQFRETLTETLEKRHPAAGRRNKNIHSDRRVARRKENNRLVPLLRSSFVIFHRLVVITFVRHPA